MLDFIEKGAESQEAYQCMEQFYHFTLQCFHSSNNERLWLKTNIKLARLWLDRKQYSTLSKKVRELHKACQREDGSDDPSKGTYSLELYALEIQMYAETKNNKRLKALYQRALRVRSAVPHPKIMGVIRECGGKMHMTEENWKEAQQDFFEAFRNYDEAGSLQRINVLKYLVLTTMLIKSDINPFESTETKAYKNDPRIAAMTDLVGAYQDDDIHRYERILQANQDLLADAFIAENIDEINRGMRLKAVAKLIAPYRRFGLAFVARQLNIAVAEVQSIVGFLICNGALSAEIDQERGIVEMTSAPDAPRTESMAQWTAAVRSLWTSVLNDGDGFRVDESLHGLSTVSYSQSNFEPALRQGSSRGIANGWGKPRGGLKRVNSEET